MQVNSEAALENGRQLLAEHGNSWMNVLDAVRQQRLAEQLAAVSLRDEPVSSDTTGIRDGSATDQR